MPSLQRLAGRAPAVPQLKPSVVRSSRRMQSRPTAYPVKHKTAPSDSNRRGPMRLRGLGRREGSWNRDPRRTPLRRGGADAPKGGRYRRSHSISDRRAGTSRGGARLFHDRRARGGSGAPMPPGLTIRRGTVDDLDQAIEIDGLIRETQERSPSFAALPERPADEIRADWLETLGDEDAVYFVTERGGRVVGHATLLPSAGLRRSARRDLPGVHGDVAGCSRRKSRPLPHRSRARLGGAGRVSGSRHELAGNQPRGLPVLARPWLQANVPSPPPGDRDRLGTRG
jgi:hypothetical protein